MAPDFLLVADRVDPVLDALNMLAREAYRRRLDDTQESLARIMVLDLYSLTLIERSSRRR